MKQETKEIVDWIKNVLIDYKNYIHDNVPQLYWSYRNRHVKAFKFLDSLPDIESHLCNGGYIQDKNGNPCCHGDKIRYENAEGILTWHVATSQFYVKGVVLDVWTINPNNLEKL